MTEARAIHSARPVFGDIPGILKDIEEVLSSGRLMLGKHTDRFEREFAEYVGTKYAIAVNSCTTALEIVFRYIGVDGREVVVPTNTFLATPNAVLYAGGRPVLTDVNEDTLALDPPNMLGAFGGYTKAVSIVHLGGLIASGIEEIVELCAERGIELVEDCAHAHGATYNGARAGSFGLAGCFSFYPTKLMTTGTGGMITTDDAGLNEFARSVRLHGRGTGGRGGLDEIIHLGNDWFVDEVRSVLGIYQLRQLDANLARRRALVARYLDRLQGLRFVSPVARDARCVPSYYKFLVVLDPGISVPALKEALLARHRIETESLYFPPCHLQPVYRDRFGYGEGTFPVAEEVLRRQLCLPLHGGLSEDDVDYVVACLKAELQAQKAMGRNS